MNKKYLLLTLIPFLLTACQNLPEHIHHPKTMTAQDHKVQLQKTLTDYTWSYQTNKNLPELKVSFDRSQNFSISTGCNQQGGAWQLKEHVLTTSLMRSTMMMCSPELMAQEKFSANLFSQSELKIQTHQKNKDTPQLSLTDQHGKEYLFTGTIKPEAKYQSEAEIVFLDISPTTKSCADSSSGQCLQVKEVKYNDQGVQTYVDKDWKLLANTIQGYTHEPKIKKLIRVKRFKTQDPKPQYAYIYDMTVQQEVLSP